MQTGILPAVICHLSFSLMKFASITGSTKCHKTGKIGFTYADQCLMSHFLWKLTYLNPYKENVLRPGPSDHKTIRRSNSEAK